MRRLADIQLHQSPCWVFPRRSQPRSSRPERKGGYERYQSCRTRFTNRYTLFPYHSWSTNDSSTKPSMPSPTGPTLRLSSQVVTAAVEQYDPVQLRLIDTPGLNLSNDPVASKARERGVAGLTRLLEERFEETLKEESRIIRTRKRQEDGMIHLGEHHMSYET
jgi:septin family protein